MLVGGQCQAMLCGT